MIKISVPNDDEAALHYFGEAMIKLAASVRGEGPVDVHVEPITLKLDDKALARLQQATSDLMEAAPAMMRENNVDGSIEIHGKRKEVEPDTTSQQVESLAIPVEANGATYETDLGSDNPQAVPVADSTDTPWDERIHSASKALNADGTWRLRRKPKDMDEAEWSEYVEEVKTVLLSINDDREKNEQILEEEYPSVIYKQEPPVTPEGDDFHVDACVVTEQQVADIPPPPPVPVPAPPVKVYGGDMTFPQVMAYLTERHGRITSAQVDQIIADMGLEKITDLNTQPEHTGPFIARVKALLGE